MATRTITSTAEDTRQLTQISAQEQLELACWLIERNDNLRASTTSRASIIVSANALLIAGITFLLDNVLSAGSQYNQLEKTLLVISLGTCILLLVFSITYAATAIAFAWKTTRESLDLKDTPKALFFKARDTVETFENLESLTNGFEATSKEQMIRYALGELFLVSQVHHKRYQTFRLAIRFLLIAIIPLLVSIATITIRLF